MNIITLTPFGALIMALRRENLIAGFLLSVIGVFLGGLIGTILLIVGIIVIVVSLF